MRKLHLHTFQNGALVEGLICKGGAFRALHDFGGPLLLWALSVQFDTIAAMVDVGCEATFKAGEIEKAAATKA